MMEGLFSSKTRRLSAVIGESSCTSSNGVVLRRKKKKPGFDFSRLSCASFDDMERFCRGGNNHMVLPLPGEPFSVEFYACESQPPACRQTWHITMCPRLFGKARKCKIIHRCGLKEYRTFSAKVVCVDDELLIYGTIKDNKIEGEDFELKLSNRTMTAVVGKRRVLLNGTLLRGNRQTDLPFTITHDSFVFA